MNRILAMLIFILVPLCALQARTVRTYVSSTEGDGALTVDSVDYRHEVTRVYATLSGRPNTSGRIDAVKMNVNGVTMECTDIEGVDFRRYFQWEEDGKISLELDFQRIKKPFKSADIIMETPRGNWISRVCLKGKK